MTQLTRVSQLIAALGRIRNRNRDDLPFRIVVYDSDNPAARYLGEIDIMHVLDRISDGEKELRIICRIERINGGNL